MFALGQVKAVDDGSDPNGEFEVILSAPTLDRDGEVVDSKIFEPLPDHITFDIDHGMSTSTTVGSGVPRYEGDLLVVRGTYSSIPRAQEVRTLVKEGHIRTTSVAFMGAEREVKDGVTHIVKAEILNGAFVPIPSNRQAVVLSAKSYADAVQKATATDIADRLATLEKQVAVLIATKTPEPASASAETDPDEAAAPAAAKSADVSAYLAAAKAQAEAASVL
jgi:hypothetical protein